MATIDASEEVRGSAPSNPPRENLVRATPGITLERAEGSAMPTLTGHFAVWDQWTEIRSAYEGNFMERFSPSSMAKTLGESTPKVMLEHGKDPQVGNRPLGTPRTIAPDNIGAFYEVPLFDASYVRELLPALEAGEYGASFRFSVVREDVVQKPSRSEHNPRGIPERTVQEARVMEFGPVLFPAYLGATAGVRSMTDEFLFEQLVDDPEKLRDLCRRAGIRLADVDASFTSGTNAGITINYTGPASVAETARFAQLYAQPVKPEPSEATTSPENDDQAPEPDASERTTPTPEPEPSEATTHSLTADFFLFATPPKHLRSK